MSGGRGGGSGAGRGGKPSARGAKPSARGAKPGARGGKPAKASSGGRAAARAGRGARRGGAPLDAAGKRSRAPEGKPARPVLTKTRPSKRPTQTGGATFVASVDSPEGFPEGPPEIAFAGRSNVGKSSLLNALSNHRSLARTSKTPGRTQRINLFDVPQPGGLVLRFADLPGYGHASVPGKIRQEFGPMIERYLLGRSTVRAVCLLVDGRREPHEDAVNFTLWLQEHGVRVELVVTKLDKLPKNQRFSILAKLKRAHFLDRAPWATSALSGEGVPELLAHLRRLATGAGTRRAR